MISSLDPFALSFDSIPVGQSKSTPSEPRAEACFADLPEAQGDGAMLFDAEDLPDAPGFYLLDDASGRVAIDRETGVVSVAHDQVLSAEPGAIHPVHIKVIENSGASYDLRFSLRLTGRVPQIASSSQEDDDLAALT